MLAILTLLPACPPTSSNDPDGGRPSDAGFEDPGECDQVVQLNQNGEASTTPAGILRCDGVLQHNQAIECSARPNEIACSGQDGTCQADADCEGSARCLVSNGECRCFPSCSSDNDCSAGEACACSGGIVDANGGLSIVNQRTKCVAADCSDDDDCGGAPCAVSLDGCGSPDGFHCHTATDNCALDADCADGSYCGFDPAAESWSCFEILICGG